jgi:hypothetical protein
VSGRTTTRLEKALSCLNDMTGLAAFEKLQVSETHISRTFHWICTNTRFALSSAWIEGASVTQNTENTARLLIDLRNADLRAIQLVGRVATADTAEQYEQAFFIPEDFSLDTNLEKLMLSLCSKYNQRAVAVYNRKRLVVMTPTGSIEKLYTPSLIQPHHLKRIWSAVTGRRYDAVETGIITASPFYLCGPVYDAVGLCSDISPGLFNRLRQPYGDIIRRSPFSTKKWGVSDED